MRVQFLLRPCKKTSKDQVSRLACSNEGPDPPRMDPAGTLVTAYLAKHRKKEKN